MFKKKVSEKNILRSNDTGKDKGDVFEICNFEVLKVESNVLVS